MKDIFQALGNFGPKDMAAFKDINKTRVMAGVAFGVAATASSFYTPALPAKRLTDEARTVDLSTIYRVQSSCEHGQVILHTFVMTKKDADISDLYNDAVPKYTIVESEGDTFERRVRMIRSVDADMFRPSQFDTKSAWDKATRYMVNPCETSGNPVPYSLSTPSR